MSDVVVVGIVVGGGVIVFAGRRFLLRRAHPGWVECGLRVLDGRVPGLSRRWRNGVGWPADGALIWTRTLPPSRRVHLVLSVSGEPPREPKGMESFWINPRCEIERVRTPDAELEVAVLPRDMARFRGLLARG